MPALKKSKLLDAARAEGEQEVAQVHRPPQTIDLP
jgi:hypothetical protein